MDTMLWVQNNIYLVVFLPLGLIVFLWVAKSFLRSRIGGETLDASKSILDLTESGSLTPEERELIKKKLHEQIKRDMEEQSSKQDDLPLLP